MPNPYDIARRQQCMAIDCVFVAEYECDNHVNPGGVCRRHKSLCCAKIAGMPSDVDHLVDAAMQVTLGYGQIERCSWTESDTGRTFMKVFSVAGLSDGNAYDQEAFWEKVMLMAQDKLVEIRKRYA